ncbi:MAG: ParA family protein [Planctomycetota bacterium]
MESRLPGDSRAPFADPSPRPRRVAFINQKGGVGKTTLTTNCGAFWARQGYRVLMLDLDPQAHLSLHLGVAEAEANLYRVLRGDLSFGDATLHLEAEYLDIVPSHIDLSAAEWEFGQEVGREVILRELLATFLAERQYDLVLMDCAPSLGFLSLNALAAADDVVIPVQAEFFALQGMAQLLRVLKMVQGRLHPGLNWRAIVPTLVDARTNLGREVIGELEKHFPGSVTRTWLSKRVKVAEAPSFGQSIFAYAPDTPAALEFETLARELAQRLGIGPPSLPPPSRSPAVTEPRLDERVPLAPEPAEPLPQPAPLAVDRLPASDPSEHGAPRWGESSC